MTLYPIRLQSWVFFLVFWYNYNNVECNLVVATAARNNHRARTTLVCPLKSHSTAIPFSIGGLHMSSSKHEYANND